MTTFGGKCLRDYPQIDAIDCEELLELREDAVDYAQGHGMVMRTSQRKNSSDICQITPFTLFPSPFPRDIFNEAVDLQKIMSLLYMRVSWDYEFLVDSHINVIKTDEFTKKFIEILSAVHHKNGKKRSKVLLIQRSDYMCGVDDASDTYKLKQIEVNNIAASMGSFAEHVTVIHGRSMKYLGWEDSKQESSLIANDPVSTIASGLFLSWYDYGANEAVVLFVIERENQNQLDQRHVEYRLEMLSDSRIKCFRLTLTQCGHRLHMSEDQSLMLDSKYLVSVVYFRAGYTPENYISQFEWDARLTIELSNAVKCPTIGLQVANTKKIQQVLSCEGVLERFLPDYPSTQVRSVFAHLWGLDEIDKESNHIIADAIAHPHRYVLKPQLEGGLGNYYGLDISDKLKAMSSDEKSAHIIMERINPVIVKNYFVRALESTSLLDVVCELGVYGYLYGYGSFYEDFYEVENFCGGHILRSKEKHVDKGGVSVGAAVIDSPYLF